MGLPESRVPPNFHGFIYCSLLETIQECNSGYAPFSDIPVFPQPPPAIDSFAFQIIIFSIENPKKITMSRLSTGITMSVSTQPQEWANLVEPIHYRSTTPMGEITVPTTETVCRLARWARWQQLGCVIAWGWPQDVAIFQDFFLGNMRFKDAWL